MASARIADAMHSFDDLTVATRQAPFPNLALNRLMGSPCHSAIVHSDTGPSRPTRGCLVRIQLRRETLALFKLANRAMAQRCVPTFTTAVARKKLDLMAPHTRGKPPKLAIVGLVPAFDGVLALSRNGSRGPNKTLADQVVPNNFFGQEGRESDIQALCPTICIKLACLGSDRHAASRTARPAVRNDALGR